MIPTRRPPGRLWLFFFGRRRRGFPGLLVGILIAAVGLGLTYRLPHGIGVSFLLGLVFLALTALLAFAAVALAVLASLRRRRRQ